MSQFISTPIVPQLGRGVLLLCSLACLGFFVNVLYNLLLHPLAGVPGPVLCRISGIPSFYHAIIGDRHIWLMKQFQTYGDKIRPEPNTVLFRGSEAYADIYGTKSNVRRSHFYEALRRNHHEITTLTSIDVAEHARRRKRLSLCFTEKVIRASSDFVVKHVDRWIHLLTLANDIDTEWSPPIDFSERVDALIFDIMGDLCFGKSFDIKEPGDNPLKSTPHNIAVYMKFKYPMCRFPNIKALLWLKPRGLEQLIEFMTPPAAKEYSRFLTDSLSDRIALQKQQAEQLEAQRRQDMFYFLAEARDPDTGALAYNESELYGESSLLIIAGSDTTSISLCGIMFYLTGDPSRYEKLAKEIRSTFQSSEDIVYGQKLMSCRYLRACVDEGMRLTPSGPCEMPREVLPGGLQIKGEFYPAGTIVGTVPWINSRSSDIYDDAESFRPERWIPTEDASGDGTQEAYRRAKAGFHPFLSGPTNCVGQNLAMATLLIVIARTLHQLDVRRVPGSTVGGGSKSLGWGRDDPRQFQLEDVYVAIKHGPEVQCRRRQSA
ncbi:benzoate 4-monooxygenase cytochrome P450 [Xylariaceae sp. FL1272]|nr:benzoate 4-monooxygenase cytochrome P450 [Xylariaceae sp. FL1272]